MSDSRLTRAGDTGGATTKTFPPSDHEAITKAARGVPDRTATTLSFVAGTRTFTVTPVSGAWSYYIAGRRYVKSAAESIVIADISGMHWIHYDGSILTDSIDPTHAQLEALIEDKVRVGLVYWNATDGAAYILGDERHGPRMSGDTQDWLHDVLGSQWIEGFDLSGYVLNSDADIDVQFEVTDGKIYDEDLDHDIVDGAAANQYEQQLSGTDAEVPILYRDDHDGSWTEDAASVLPYKHSGANRLAFNNDDLDGTWSQVEVDNNKFLLATLVATNDWAYPIKMIQGQAQYATRALALEGAETEQIAWGTMPSPELVVLYRFLLQTNTGFGGTKNLKIIEIIDLRRRSLTGGAVAPAEPHAILSNTHSDSLATTVTRGSLIYGNATPEWAELLVSAIPAYLKNDGTDVMWDSTVVTAGANITDHAVVRGDGGALGVQDSLAILSDAGALSGLTQLTVDNLVLNTSTLSIVGGTDLIFLPAIGSGIQVLVRGTDTADIDALQLVNRVWDATMIDTRTSLVFRQAYDVGGNLSDSARITAHTETNWTGVAATVDSAMSFHTVLDGVVTEQMRISSAGVLGINTTDPGGLTASVLLDIRQNGRCSFAQYTYSNTASHDSRWFAARARGTEGAEDTVQDNDVLAIILAQGWAVSDAFRTAAYIKFDVDGVPALTTVPGAISFWTTTTAAPALRMTIQSDGDILVDSGTSVFIRDAALGFNSSADGQLDIFADTECEITAPTIDLTAATAVILRSVNGIDYGTGAIADMDLITVLVTDFPRLWWDESRDAFAMTKRLDLPEGVQTKYAVDDVTDPPTDAELDTAFGDPTVVGPGFVGILDDAGAGLYCYICWTTGTAGEWFYLAGTKAV